MLPVALHVPDAWAWGLYSHVYFAQLLIWAVPLADPRFRRAVRRFPDLLLAGACLPDLSLFSRWVRSDALGETHQWTVARRMLQEARDDREAALATGFGCHLLSDIVAHNDFVPAHETLWINPSHIAVHAAAEWAMDAHLSQELFARPGTLIRRNLPEVSAFAARHFAVPQVAAAGALRCLMRGEGLLRASGLHRIAYRGALAADRATARRFDDYAAFTARSLGQVNRLIAGDAPDWPPEVDCAHRARERYAAAAQGRHLSLMLPRDFFS